MSKIDPNIHLNNSLTKFKLKNFYFSCEKGTFAKQLKSKAK